MSSHKRNKHRKKGQKAPRDNRKSLLFPNSKYAVKLTRKRGDELQKEVTRLLRKVDHPMFKSTFRIIQLHIFYVTGLRIPLDELFNERKMLVILPDDVNLDRWIYLKTASKSELEMTRMNVAMMKKLHDLGISQTRTHATSLSTIIPKLWESSNSSSYNSSDYHSSSSSYCSDFLPLETKQAEISNFEISRPTTHNGFAICNLAFGSQNDKQHVLQHVFESNWPAASPDFLPLPDDDENPEHKLSLAERCKKLLGSLN